MPNPANANADLGGHKLLNAGVITTALTTANVQWDASHAYAINDIIADTAVSNGWWRCIAANTNQRPPDASFWESLPLNSVPIYYGSGPYDIILGLASSPDTIQVRPNTVNSSFNFGGAIGLTGAALPAWVTTPGANISCTTGVIDDSQQCVGLGNGDIHRSNLCFAAGDCAITSSSDSICLGEADLSYANQCIAIGCNITGVSEVSRVASSFSMGVHVTSSYSHGLGQNTCSVTADHCTAIGENFTNSTANTIQIGYSDARKLTLDANGNLTLRGTVWSADISGNVTANTLTAATNIVATAYTHSSSPVGTPLTAANSTICPVDTSGGTVAVKLPPPASSSYVVFQDAAANFDTNNLSVIQNASEKINGVAATLVVTGRGAFFVLISDGVNWNIPTQPAPPQVNNQTGTTFAPALADAGSFVKISNAAAITVTIPANASVPFPIGTEIYFMQGTGGSGVITIAITSDTLVSAGSKFATNGQYAVVGIKKILSTTWVLFGDRA